MTDENKTVDPRAESRNANVDECPVQDLCRQCKTWDVTPASCALCSEIKTAEKRGAEKERERAKKLVVATDDLLYMLCKLHDEEAAEIELLPESIRGFAKTAQNALREYEAGK